MITQPSDPPVNQAIGKHQRMRIVGQTPTQNLAHITAIPFMLGVLGSYIASAWMQKVVGSEWSAALSHEIRAAQQRGDPDLGRSYYHHWLNTLERLCAEKGLLSGAEMQRRKERWRRAYLHTPHGQPVELSAAGDEDLHVVPAST